MALKLEEMMRQKSTKKMKEVKCQEEQEFIKRERIGQSNKENRTKN